MFSTWEWQKMLLEANKRLSFDAEMQQSADNKCVMNIKTRSKYGVLGGDIFLQIIICTHLLNK